MGAKPSCMMDRKPEAVVPVQIITLCDGKFSFDASILEQVLSNVPKLRGKTAVAFISVIGQPKSGKSFLANLMLEYLMKDGKKKGNWIENLTKKKEKLNGFVWNEDQPAESISGHNISIWPQPFVLKNVDQEQTVLFVLDSYNDDQDIEAQKALEIFLWLLCPNVIVSQMKNIDLDVLLLRKKVMDSHTAPFPHQISWVIQNVAEKTTDISLGNFSKKEQQFEKYIANLNLGELKYLWADIENKIVFALPQPQPGNTSLLNDKGYLSLQTKYINHVKTLIDNMMEEIRSVPNFQPDNVTLFLQQSTDWANENLKRLLEPHVVIEGEDIRKVKAGKGNKKKKTKTNANSEIRGQPETITAESTIKGKEETNSASTELCLTAHDDNTEISTSNSEEERKGSIIHLTQNIQDNTTEYHQGTNASMSSQLLQQLKEEADKIINIYLKQLDALLQAQTEDCNETLIMEFHQKESSEIMKHLNSFIQQQNIPSTSDSEEIMSLVQSRIDAEFSERWNLIIKQLQEKHVPKYTEDEFHISSTKQMEKLMSLIISSSNQIFHHYDQNMENYCNQPNPVKQDLLTLHNLLINEFLSSQNIWSSYFVPVFQRGVDPQIHIQMQVHMNQLLNKRFQYYETILRNKHTSAYLRSTLITFFSSTFESELVEKLMGKIEEGGFNLNSLKQLVIDTHNEIIPNVIKRYNNKTYFHDEEIIGMVNTAVAPITEVITTLLKTAVENYQKSIDQNYKQQICFTAKDLDLCHEAAVKSVMQHVSTISTSTKGCDALLKTALNFAKNWNVSRNEEMRKSLIDAAPLALSTLDTFYHQEMKYILSSKIYSKRKLSEVHEKLKNECFATFCKAMYFYCDPDKYGIDDHSVHLKTKMDKLFEEYLLMNEKALVDGLKSVKSITGNAIKNFSNNLTDKLSTKGILHQEFDEIFNQVKNEIVSQMKEDFKKQVPNEDFSIHQKLLECQIQKIEKEMREANESLQLQQANRGCVGPPLCIEFGLDVIRVGYFNSEENFAYIPNPTDFKIDIKNTISFLDTNEVIIGNVETEKIKNIDHEIKLEKLLTVNSTQTKMDLPKDIKFKGQIIPNDLEFLCSIVFAKIKEMAEDDSKETFLSTVISVPTRFHSGLRQTIKTAGKIAGFQEIFLINDSTAAALQYFKDQSNKSCLVVFAGIHNCDAAIYTHTDEGKQQMKFSFRDRNIPKLIPNWSFSDDNNEVDVFSVVLEEMKKSKKKFESTILICNNESIIQNCTKALEKAKIKSSIIVNNDILPNHMVLQGIAEYSQRLKQNILHAESTVSDLTPYKFVCEDIRNFYHLMTKNFQNGSDSDTSFRSKGNGKKTLKFYELANGNKIHKFDFGQSELVTKIGQEIQVKVRVSHEGIYNVQLIAAGNSIPIALRSLQEEQMNSYADIIGKLFKRNPQLESIENAKKHLKSICQDMKERFDQMTVKSEFIKDMIMKEVEDAIDLTNNPNVDLQTLEQKTKTLVTYREKKYPPKSIN